MPDINARTLRNVMAQFVGGSDGRYRHPFNKRFIYTEGVKAVADAAGAYWLLDIVATEVAPLCLQQWQEREVSTFMFEMTVRDRRVQLRLTWSDDQPPLWKRDLDYTDFPEGEWTFELAVDGLIAAGGYVLVMLLLEEH